jgi:Protein of unknown function (DUF3224)
VAVRQPAGDRYGFISGRTYSIDELPVFPPERNINDVLRGYRQMGPDGEFGIFEGGKARSSWSIIAGAGTGELARLRGEGSYVATHGALVPVSLHYHFETNVKRACRAA